MLKVGILLNGVNVPVWVSEIITTINEMPEAKIVVAVINKANRTDKNKFTTLGYRLLRNIDKRIMRESGDPFKKEKLNLANINCLNVIPKQTKYSDYFPEEIIKVLSDENIDVFLRFGFRVLRGDILSIAKYGIVSLHHGDTTKYRGGPPAFWEVVNKTPVTKVTVQMLTEELDGGKILGEATLRTDKNSFYRNQVKLYWAGKELLLSLILRLVKDPFSFQGNCIVNRLSYSDPLYKNPVNSTSFFIAIQWILFNFKRKITELVFTQQWQLLYSKNIFFPASFHRYKQLLPPPDRIWADPFVMKKGNYFVFFEEKLNTKDKAHISCFEFDLGGNLVNKVPKIVLSEGHHLSYPFLFTYNGEEYLMPESAASKELSLYKCNKFPTEWVKFKTLLSGKSIYDATLYFYNNMWYLFCNEKSDNRLSSDAYLHIYFSKDFLTIPFSPHPMNPIYRDVTRSRPAGNLFFHNGMLIRPSQISAPNYGSGIQLNHITELSPEIFNEVKLETLFPNWNSKAKGFHTLNHMDGFTVADIQARRFRWI